MKGQLFWLPLLLAISVIGCQQAALLTHDEMDARMDLLLIEDAEALIMPTQNLGGYAYKSESDDKLTYLVCIDSDGGLVINEWGKIAVRYVYGRQIHTTFLGDVCEGTKLREFYCNGKTPARRTHFCSSACEHGACVGI